MIVGINKTLRIDDIINRLNLSEIMRGRKSFSMAEIEKLKQLFMEKDKLIPMSRCLSDGKCVE